MFKKIKILVDYYWNRATNKENMIKIEFVKNNPFQYNDVILREGEDKVYMRCLRKNWFVKIKNDKYKKK